MVDVEEMAFMREDVGQHDDGEGEGGGGDEPEPVGDDPDKIISL